MSAEMERSGGLRVAMIGQRGVPATFGGIEHHVEQLGWRLAARGHEVTVFCRTNYVTDRQPTYRGMRLRHLPTVSSKHLDAIVHSALSTLSALAGRFDVIHYHALGPGLLTPLPRCLSRARVVQTIHGLDNERAKWGLGAKAVLTSAAWLSARVPDATIVVSQALARHYRSRYGRSALHIPNGVNEPPARPDPAEITLRWGLTKGSYLLFVGRLVPEKAPDLLVRAFREIGGDRRLVIAGDSCFTDGYAADVRQQAAADPRVLFVGYVYGQSLAELYNNAAGFVLPSSLEGFPLTLLEAASYGTPIVASDIPPHVEVLGHDGHGHRLFPSGDKDGLVSALHRCLADQPAEKMGGAATGRQVLRRYRWDDVAAATEQAYLRLVHGRCAGTDDEPSIGSTLEPVRLRRP
ncbi:MAG: glycosyltransferase family 4 protein [Egibacteraceae bacterium]